VKAPLYFASGSSRPADIRGFAAIGHAIGVAAPEVSPNAERELAALAGTGVQVFVDSGAFSEVEFSAAGVTVVRPITDADWTERLALYTRLARALGPQVHVVAPDRIGDQGETLARLAKYAPELRALRALGANVLVPVQKGEKSQAAFVRDIEAAIGFSDFVHAIPSKKKATSMTELRAYLEEVRPARLHFLGLGLKNANAGQVLAFCAELVPGASVSFDSNLIAANVGRGGRVPRRLTAARDEAAALIAAGGCRFSSAQELGIIFAFGTPADRVAAVGAARVAPRQLELAA
jgi:hypothetical protein